MNEAYVSRADFEQLQKDAYNLLMSPYLQMEHYAITTVCVRFRHPLTPRGERCPCGKIKHKKETA